MSDYTLILGDCLEELAELESGSVDAIFADPPYPYIKRDYGYWTEAEWMPMMQEVVRQSRRILKPHGSAVFVLQPNSEKVGKMRLWLWRFMVWAGEEWGIVQDAYWWNTCQIPSVHTHLSNGLLRPSVKFCLWIGNDNCYRNQASVFWGLSEATVTRSAESRILKTRPSGYSNREGRMYATAQNRNGSTPFNILPIGNGGTQIQGKKHGAGTPLKLADWWLRYIAKPGGVVLDMFSGTSTTGVAARRLNLGYIGIERTEKYHEIAKHRLATALDDRPKPSKKPVTDLPMFAEATL